MLRSAFGRLFATIGMLFALCSAYPIAVDAQNATPVAPEASPVVTVAAASGPITVLASGLTNPRGFDWAPDGTLYLALAGNGGGPSIAVAPGFTVDHGLSSSIVTVAGGCATPVALGLVSSVWEEAGWIWGAMDVTFLDGEPYALLSGAGPSFLSPSSLSGVFRLNADGTMTLVADLTNWLPQHPPTFMAPDAGSDGSLFDLEAAGDSLVLSVADIGLIIRVTPATGEIATVADLSEGHLVPDGLAVDGDGNIYVGFETTPPYDEGMSKVVKIAPDGSMTDVWTGLTAVTDIAIGPDGLLYASEMSTVTTDAEPFLTPNTGKIVRQTGPDTQDDVVTELPYPVYIGFDASGRLVIDTPAFGPDKGEGQGTLVSVDISSGPVSYAGFQVPASNCPA